MNWKLLAGQALHKLDTLTIRSNSSFIKKNYPYRRNLLFDLKRTLPEPKTIFDVGAHVGDMALEFHHNFKNAKIYAFEPVTENFNKLKLAVANKAEIDCYKLALGEVKKTVEIPLYGDTSITTLKEAAYDAKPMSSEKIDVIRLDQFLLEHNIPNIDILKLDVEGYEFEVLKGAGEFLSKVNCIITEVGYSRCNTKTHFADMDRFMEENGFFIFNIYELLPAYNDRSRLFYSNNVYLRA